MKIFSQFKKEKKQEMYTVGLFALALFIFLSLVSSSSPQNYIGIIGVYVAEGLIIAFGSIGAYLVPLSFSMWGWQNLKQIKREKVYIKAVGFVIFLISVCGLLSLINKDTLRGVDKIGGYLGAGLTYVLVAYVGFLGAYIVLITALILSLLLATRFSIIPSIIFLQDKAKQLWAQISAVKNKENPKQVRIKKPQIAVKEPVEQEKKPPTIKMPITAKIKELREKEADRAKYREEGKKPLPVQQEFAGIYNLPPLSLLEVPPPVSTDKMEESLKAEAATLERTLHEFSISASVTQICPGPVITRYEVQLAPGVKVNRIVNLSDNIALAMEASHVRILAPIPGKKVVGIEVPNRFANLVYMRELLESEQYQNTKATIPLALGKTIAGEPYVADLQKMPHLLIAGATGSGKSICIHALINSILFNASPEKVKFLMIDQKMIELPIYNDIPHLITPVITDVRKAAHALKWVVAEMENRYRKFADVRAKGIDGYNSNEGVEKLPYLVLIVDELADLMILSSIEVEDAIIRIAQMARAVGIHIILATQRPSVDVITGVIKANFPARIAFQTLSATDSRIILDMAGADDLLGSGDMLFLPIGAPKPVRIQGSFIRQKEAESVVEFILEQKKASYRDDVFHTIRDGSPGDIQKDVLFDDAIKVIINTGQASISLLQRRLGIGYNRSARLIDCLESKGIIGPPDGTKPREILVSEDYSQEKEAVKNQ
ncbi:MAG: DNA translocase FtsK [bacterium]